MCDKDGEILWAPLDFLDNEAGWKECYDEGDILLLLNSYITMLHSLYDCKVDLSHVPIFSWFQGGSVLSCPWDEYELHMAGGRLQTVIPWFYDYYEIDLDVHVTQKAKI